MGKHLHNLLANKLHDTALKQAAKSYFYGRLIDIGCGTKPYKLMLSSIVNEHIGVDHWSSPHDKSNVDLVGSAYEIPVPAESFDAALCTAVLEHLEEPQCALAECFRILKPDGRAIYTVPFIWHIHEEPRDFYRFSKFGLEYLFKKSGFTIVEIKALSGFWVTFGQMLSYNINRFNRGPLRWLRIVDAVCLLVQGLAYLLERIDKTEDWTWMYLVVATKPSNRG